MSNEDYLSPDYDPFQNSGPPIRSGPNWGMIIGIIAATSVVCMLLCCGGLWYFARFGAERAIEFGVGFVAREVRREIEDHPVIQEQIGEIRSFELDVEETENQAGAGGLVFRIEGSKGSGLLAAESFEVDGDSDSDAAFAGELTMDSGEVFAILPEAEESPPEGTAATDNDGTSPAPASDPPASDANDAQDETTQDETEDPGA